MIIFNQAGKYSFLLRIKSAGSSLVTPEVYPSYSKSPAKKERNNIITPYRYILLPPAAAAMINISQILLIRKNPQIFATRYNDNKNL